VLIADVIKDAMDPQFLANLQKMGQVAVDPGNQMRAVSEMAEGWSSGGGVVEPR